MANVVALAFNWSLIRNTFVSEGQTSTEEGAASLEDLRTKRHESPRCVPISHTVTVCKSKLARNSFRMWVAVFWRCDVEKWLNKPPRNWVVVNKVFQLILKRIFMCDWLVVGKCLGADALHCVLDYALDFALCLLAGLAAAVAFMSFHFLSVHFISYHFLSVHFISCHVPWGMKWISTWMWISGKRNQRKNQRRKMRKIHRKNQRVWVAESAG